MAWRAKRMGLFGLRMGSFLGLFSRFSFIFNKLLASFWHFNYLFSRFPHRRLLVPLPGG